ncbi:MAG TPA: Crp/Fnr family transcriptional regulator [Chromatiaceae bacterium]|nr:Crp/Fnr family transcriptional regulator [Chromatiaceae bacterium]
MDAYSISGVLSRLPLFGQLGMDALFLISKSACQFSASKGEQIFAKGEPVEGFYHLLSGKVKLAFLSSRGNEKIVDIVNSGQSFGEFMLLADQPWPFYAQVIQDANLLFVEKRGFVKLLGKEGALKDHLLHAMSQRLCDLISHMEALCMQTSRERIVGYLLREIEQSRARGSSEQVVELPDTKANTASLLNLTPETFSRIIHNLEREKIVDVSRRTVRVLDLERLQQGCGC